MAWLRAASREFFGLFVDDASFALAIAAWLGIAWWLLPRLAQATPWSGVILFVGLLGILVESAWRRARR